MTFSVGALFDETSPQAVPAGTTYIPTDDDISELVHGSITNNASITDKLLAQHTTSDLGDMSAKMTQLVAVSKGFDPGQAKHTFAERALGFFRNEREQLLSHMQTVKQQIDGIVGELKHKAELHKQRILDIGQLQRENLDFHEERKAAVAKFQEWLSAVDACVQEPLVNGAILSTTMYLQHLKQRLESAIADAQNAMTLAKQNAIKLQLTANTSQGILDQFERIEANVIPALKSVLEQQLLGMEQKEAVAVDDMLSATLDSALRTSAQLTADNSVSVAKMQQKSIINFQTIADCQRILDETATQVREIEDQGRLERIEDAAKRTILEQEMLASIRR